MKELIRKLSVAILAVYAVLTASAFDTKLRSKGCDVFMDSVVEAGAVYEFSCRCDYISEQSFEIGLDPLRDKFDLSMEFIPADSTCNSLIVKAKAYQFNKFDSEDFDKAHIVALSGDSVVGECYVENLKQVYRRTNFLRLSVYGDGSTIAFGNSTLEDAMKLPPLGFFKSVKFTSKHKAKILRTVTSFVPAPPIFNSGLAEDEICRAATDGVFPCGLWRRFDDSYETKFADRGGNYILAIVPMAAVREKLKADSSFASRPADECYPIDKAHFAIMYLDGATSYPHLWHPGDVKGLLTLTPFINTYELTWIDSSGNPITFGANATFDSNLLSLNFPLLSSIIRLCPAN